MIRAQSVVPRVSAYKGSAVSTQIDRVQNINATPTLNRTKINEVGREDLVAWRKSIPSTTLTFTQFEYGEMEFWRQLANTTLTDTKVELTDFESTAVDIALYATDSGDDTFLGTIWYPDQRMTGFSLNIGDPEAVIERSINLIGEDKYMLQDDNQYLIFLLDTSCTGASHDIVINSGTFVNYPVPIADPDQSGSDTYILKLVKVTAAGVASELVLTTDYTYTAATRTINIPGSASGDTFKVYYSAGSYITGSDTWTDNDLDASALLATYCSIYLQTSDYVYKLQSVSVDVAFSRYDAKEIGNESTVERGVNDTTVTINLGRILDAWTVEEVVRGVAAGYGKIDIKEFKDDITLYIKMYSDADKDTFLIGYEFTNLTPTSLADGVTVQSYVTNGMTLSGQSGFICSQENLL